MDAHQYDLPNWLLTSLALVVAFSAIGSCIDFLIGKARQKKVRTWLELNWYRFSDLRWRQMGADEAQAYVKLSDAMFGARLLSIRRLVAVTVVVAVSCMASASYIQLEGRWVSYPLISEFGWKLLFSACLFAVSLSLSRLVSTLIARVTVASAIVSFLAVLALLGVHLLLANLWTSLQFWIMTFFDLTKETLDLLLRGAEVDWDFFLTTVNDYVSTPIRRLGISWGHVLPQHFRLASIGYPGLTGVANGGAYIVVHSGNILRLSIVLVFFGSFLFEYVFRRFAFLIWARVVENERPVFTLIFGGIGAAASLLQSIVKLL